MSANCSFGVNEEEEREEEIDLNTLAKVKDKELTLENIMDDSNNEITQNNNQIFNQVSTKEIEDIEDNTQLEFYQNLLIKEKINSSLKIIFSSINNILKSYKSFFFNKLKIIMNKQYSNMVQAQMLYINISMQLKNFVFLYKFNQLKKKKDAFYNLKQFAFYKKKQIQEEQNMKREKENKINVLNNKLNSINNTINETDKKIGNLDNIQKRLSGENKDIKVKISQMNEKVNQLIKYGNTIKENIVNKKNQINNINNNNSGKNQENRIQNLKTLIEQKESEKEREMKDIDKFCENMDLVLNQYESMSETIISNSNINIKK